MEYELVIGATVIPYDVRLSDIATRKSIHVIPGGVEVVAPDYQDLEEIHAFVQKKRRWVFDAVIEIEEKAKHVEPSPRFLTGAKVSYRGRRLKLTVIRDEATEVAFVDYRSRFDVHVPAQTSPDDVEALVEKTLEQWMREHCLREARRFARHYASKLKLDTPPVRLTANQKMWGVCGKDGTLGIHWGLIQAPIQALEYVVAHEVCHLLDRSHSDAFWRLLDGVLPQRAAYQRYLEDQPLREV